MATPDFSPIVSLMPVITFLIVWIVVYTILVKTKIIEVKFLQLLLSFLVATVFIVSANARVYVENVVPWFAVLVVSGAFILGMLGFLGKDVDFLKKGVGAALIIIFLVGLVVAGIAIYSTSLLDNYYMLTSYPRVYGAVLLALVGAIVSWILVKMK